MNTQNKVKDQVITDRYAIYESDCMEVLPTLEDESIDLSVYSPPFCGLYTYSSSERDMSNCHTNEEFLQQYEFLVKEMARVTKKGRINAVHCTDIHNHNGSLWDFPNEIIRLHEANGFVYQCKITVWKEPLAVRTRTMVQSLMHKFIIEDSTRCFPAMPDYILLFKRKGENKVPVTHEQGLTHYAGATPILDEMMNIYNRANNSSFKFPLQMWNYLNEKYKDHEDAKTNKLSHFIWQRYASAVWDDIRVDNVLPFKKTKEDDDEKHVHPLQLDVIDRIVELYSNPDEVVFTPFMGVGSEVFSPVSMGRKAIGIELKSSYFKQATLNMKEAEKRFKAKAKQEKLF